VLSAFQRQILTANMANPIKISQRVKALAGVALLGVWVCRLPVAVELEAAVPAAVELLAAVPVAVVTVTAGRVVVLPIVTMVLLVKAIPVELGELLFPPPPAPTLEHTSSKALPKSCLAASQVSCG